MRNRFPIHGGMPRIPLFCIAALLCMALLTFPAMAATAAFSASPTSGTVPLTIQFTDASTASAIERVTNGVFETGDMTGWTAGGDWSAVVGNARTGTYSAMSNANPSSILSQTVDLTGVSDLSFWYYADTQGSDPGVSVTIDGTTVYSGGNAIDAYTQVSIPTTSYTGTHIVAWHYSGEDTEVWIDDITATGPGTITAWSWNFGDGGTSTEQSPLHTYTAAGTYSVSLTATDASGSNTATQTNLITVSPAAVAPVAAFSGTPTSGTAPLTVAFTDQSTNTPTSWSWTFGDGSTSTAKNPSHQYTTAGTYTVALTATNAGGSNTATQTNYITVTAAGPKTWYVAPTGGDYTDIQSAINAASSGDTIFIRAGTYAPDSLDVPAGKDGLTLQGENAGVVTIALSNGDPSQAKLNVESGGVTITDLTFQSCMVYSNSGTGGTVITDNVFRDPPYDEGAIVLVTSNNIVRNNVVSGATGGYSAMAIYQGNNLVENNTVTGGAVAGLSFYGWNSTIMKNTFSNNAYAGIEIYNDGGQIENNRIYLNTINSNGVPVTTSGTTPPVNTYWVSPEVVSYTYKGNVYSGNLGNYWDTAYTGTDTDGNGIGDTAYTVPDSLGSDTAPLMGAWNNGAITSTAPSVPAPVAAFNGTPTSGAAPLTVQFTDQSTNTPTSWAWTFGDGNTTNATEQDPVHEYSAAGTYNVTLTATNSAGYDIEEKTGYITVSAAPVTNTVNLSADADSYIRWGTAYGDTNFGTASIFNVYIYSGVGTIWGRSLIHFDLSSIPEGSTIESATLHAYKSAYTLTPDVYAYRITNPWNETEVTWNNWDSNASIAAGPSAVATTTAAKEWVSWDVTNDVQAYASGTAQNYGWMLNLTDTTRPASTIKATFNSRENTANPPYLIVTYHTTSGTVTPTAAFSANTTNGIAPLTVQFTDASTNSPTSWAWNFGDGSTSTAQNPVHEYSAVGTYNVTLMATNSAGSDSEEKTDYITVSPASVVPVAAFSGTPTSGVAPLTVQFTDASTNSPTSWSWDFGDSDSTNATEQNPVHTYSTAGTYNVSLTATNAGGNDTATQTNYITVSAGQMPDLIILLVNTNSQTTNAGGSLFALEPNTVRATVKNNGTAASPAAVLSIVSSDGFTGTGTISALVVGAQTYVSVTDPTIREQGATVTYTATADPDNLVAETSETNNVKTSTTKTAVYNGYKGAQYWTGKGNDTTYRTYDLHGGLVYSSGDGQYRSGSFGSGWYTYDTQWTAANLPIPTGATVKEARLYVPYTWDNSNDAPDNVVLAFNGVNVSYEHWEHDQSNFGAYGNYAYGLMTYNVTGEFLANGANTATFTRPGYMDAISPYGFTLAVVYEDASATRKQIFLNEGFDLLGASPTSYATTEEEATAYVPFSGMTIDTANVATANLITFVPSGYGPEGNLYFNGNTLGTEVWSYDLGVNTQVAVDVRDVKSYLTAEDNEAAIQSSDMPNACMAAAQEFLVVEYANEVSAPVADFSADQTGGTAPLTVTFTDASTNAPTEWLWDFGDSDSTNATEQNPVHTYAAAGTYNVSLTASNTAGSNTATQTGYITVTSGIIALPGQTLVPTDPDHDGLYEDLNGNGGKDLNDAVVYFKNIDWVVANEPVSAFDYNGNGGIDLNDIILLYKEIIG